MAPTNRAHLRALPGEGLVAGVSPERLVTYWETAVDQATDELVRADRADAHVVRARFYAACDMLQAALNRRDRANAERAGRRWLWVAGGAHG